MHHNSLNSREIGQFHERRYPSSILLYPTPEQQVYTITFFDLICRTNGIRLDYICSAFFPWSKRSVPWSVPHGVVVFSCRFSVHCDHPSATHVFVSCLLVRGSRPSLLVPGVLLASTGRFLRETTFRDLTAFCSISNRGTRTRVLALYFVLS